MRTFPDSSPFGFSVNVGAHRQAVPGWVEMRLTRGADAPASGTEFGLRGCGNGTFMASVMLTGVRPDVSVVREKEPPAC